MKKNTTIFLIAIIFFILALALIVLIINRRKTTSEEIGGQILQSQLPPAQTNSTGTNKMPGLNSDRSAVDINESSRDIALPGKRIDNSELLAKYGRFAYETFKKQPALINQIKALDKDFNPSQMDPSFPSRVYQLNSGKEYLALGGCTAHSCSGTKIIVIYDEKDDKAYMAKEDSSETQLQILGNPGDQERSLLIYFYFHK